MGLLGRLKQTYSALSATIVGHPSCIEAEIGNVRFFRSAPSPAVVVPLDQTTRMDIPSIPLAVGVCENTAEISTWARMIWTTM
jgi:hypothetical protein